MEKYDTSQQHYLLLEIMQSDGLFIYKMWSQREERTITIHKVEEQGKRAVSTNTPLSLPSQLLSYPPDAVLVANLEEMPGFHDKLLRLSLSSTQKLAEIPMIHVTTTNDGNNFDWKIQVRGSLIWAQRDRSEREGVEVLKKWDFTFSEFHMDQITHQHYPRTWFRPAADVRRLDDRVCVIEDKQFDNSNLDEVCANACSMDTRELAMCGYRTIMCHSNISQLVGSNVNHSAPIFQDPVCNEGEHVCVSPACEDSRNLTEMVDSDAGCPHTLRTLAKYDTRCSASIFRVLTLPVSNFWVEEMFGKVTCRSKFAFCAFFDPTHIMCTGNARSLCVMQSNSSEFECNYKNDNTRTCEAYQGYDVFEFDWDAPTWRTHTLPDFACDEYPDTRGLFSLLTRRVNLNGEMVHLRCDNKMRFCRFQPHDEACLARNLYLCADRDHQFEDGEMCHAYIQKLQPPAEIGGVKLQQRKKDTDMCASTHLEWVGSPENKWKPVCDKYDVPLSNGCMRRYSRVQGDACPDGSAANTGFWTQMWEKGDCLQKWEECLRDLAWQCATDPTATTTTLHMEPRDVLPLVLRAAHMERDTGFRRLVCEQCWWCNSSRRCTSSGFQVPGRGVQGHHQTDVSCPHMDC